MEAGNQTGGEPRYPVEYSVDYPDRDLNRLTTAFTLIWAIPIAIVLATLRLAGLACVIRASFAILFTGRYPRGLLDVVVGVIRRGNRVVGYAFVRVTDEYPPFRLEP